MNETLDKDRSFAYFVYPFLFDLPTTVPPERQASSPSPDDPFCVFANRVAASTLDQKQVWTDWKIPINDLMPHVASFLNAGNTNPTGRFWQLDNNVAQKLQTNKIKWKMLRGTTAAPMAFTLGGDFVLQLALFRHGVGFITVSAHPVSNDLGDWLAFLHDFRFMHHRNDVRVCAEKEAYDQSTKQKTRIAYNPLNVPGATADQSFWFMDLIKIVLKASGLDATTDVFTPGHTLPYTSLFVRGTDETDKTTIRHRLRNFFGPAQGENLPAEDLCENHPAHLAYARDQWFIQTLNGGSFLAFERVDEPLDQFQKVSLPNHLSGVYFCANILVLYQRFALARLSEKVATKALTPDGSDQVWEGIRDDLLDFTARGYFTQAMQSDHHHRYYRKWQEVLQIQQLYDEVRNEVRDLYERATLRLRKRDDERDKREEEREKRVEQRLSLLGPLFAIPALIFGFLGVNIREFSSGFSLRVVLICLMGGLAFATGTFLVLTNFSKREKN